MEPKISAERFEREYAERADIDLEELRKYRTVVRCQCDYEDCEGWAMVSHEAAQTDYAPGGIYGWMSQEE